MLNIIRVKEGVISFSHRIIVEILVKILRQPPRGGEDLGADASLNNTYEVPVTF